MFQPGILIVSTRVELDLPDDGFRYGDVKSSKRVYEPLGFEFTQREEEPYE